MRYDYVIFGASGYTGQYVVEFLANALKRENDETSTWAVSGRNETKDQADAQLSNLVSGIFSWSIVLMLVIGVRLERVETKEGLDDGGKPVSIRAIPMETRTDCSIPGRLPTVSIRPTTAPLTRSTARTATPTWTVSPMRRSWPAAPAPR